MYDRLMRASAPRVSDRTGECHVYFEMYMEEERIAIKILSHESPQNVCGEGTFTHENVWVDDLEEILNNAMASGREFSSSIFKKALPSDNNNSALLVAILRHLGILKRVGQSGSYRSKAVKSIGTFKEEQRKILLNRNAA